MRKLAVLTMFLVFSVSQIAVAASVVGEFNCIDHSGKIADISGKAYGTDGKIESAKIRIQKKGEAAVEYVAQVGNSNVFFADFSSDQHDGLKLDVYGDDMGDMSSIQFGNGSPIDIQCSYQQLN